MRNQMMCCGTARFTTRTGYGTTLGQVRAELAAFGKVRDGADAAASFMPPTTGQCDLFLDASTPWRHCYVAAKVESAGEDGEGEEVRCHYAVSLKEGHSSGWLRILVLCGAAAGAAVLCLSRPDSLWTVPAFILGALLLLVIWITPIPSAYRLPGRIRKKLEGLDLRA